jgi:mono/diheme cytochrome c family protein
MLRVLAQTRQERSIAEAVTMQARRRIPKFVSALGIALALLVGAGGTARSQWPPGNVTYLGQGWGYDTAEWWYHISQGTVFMPYQWFVALEQASGDALFASSDHLERLGFLADLPTAPNPRGLPVGFSIRQLDIPSRPPYQFWKGEWIGFACAACHTGQLRFHGQQIRIEGGPAHLDIETFGDELAAAFAATATSELKFTRFAARVLASGAATTPDQLKASFAGFVQSQIGRTALFEVAQAAASMEPTRSGLGRLDAVHRGGNLLLSAPLAEPRNYVPTTAPVRFPALWDTPYLDWVLYNGSIREPLARNVIEALGVGAPIDPATMLTDNIAHGVLMDNVVSIHRTLTRLQSPRWPEDVFGKIDLDKARQGEAIYRQTCAGCHALIDRGSHSPLAAAGGTGPAEVAVTMVPLDQVGTDPRQAVNFASRVITLEKIGGPAQIPYMDAARTVAGGVVEQWQNQSAANAAAEQEVDGGRPNEFRGLPAYRARPLNGIWAIGPYLHNGSVPSLYDLLLPPPQRPRIFFAGSWEFDPGHVGLETGSPFAGAFMFDTRLPGNANGGHEYGTDLSATDRMALIEFLKTL